MAWGTPVATVSASGNDNVTTGSIDTSTATLLVMAVTSLSSQGAPTASDSKGNTWNSMTFIASTSLRVTVFYAFAKGGGALDVGSGHTFTSTRSSGFQSVNVAAFPGGNTTAPFGAESAGGSTAGATTVQPGSLTPSEDNMLLIAACGGGTPANPFSVDSPFTIAVQNDGGVDNFPSALAYSIQTTATARNPTFTLTATTQSAAAMGSFKVAGAGGGSAGKPVGGTLTLPGIIGGTLVI